MVFETLVFETGGPKTVTLVTKKDWFLKLVDPKQVTQNQNSQQ